MTLITSLVLHFGLCLGWETAHESHQLSGAMQLAAAENQVDNSQQGNPSDHRHTKTG